MNDDRIQCLLRFGNDVIDLSQVVALVGRTVHLTGGQKIGVGVATADALRAAIPHSRALPRDTSQAGIAAGIAARRQAETPPPPERPCKALQRPCKARGRVETANPPTPPKKRATAQNTRFRP